MNLPLVPLRKIVKISYGKALKSVDRVENGNIPVFGSSGKVGFHDSSLIDHPTIIIGRKGSVGKVIFADRGGWAIDTVFYTEFLQDNQVDLRYFFYALKQAHLDRWTITTSIPGLNRDDLYSTKIPLPPIATQRRIASILDKADEIRRKRQEAIKLTEELGRSLFLDMFGDPVTNPKGWEIVKMKNIVRETQYGTSQKSNLERKGIPVLRMNNITYKGELDLNDIKWCEIAQNEKEKYTVKKGDLLFNRTNSPELVGKTSVWNKLEKYAFAGYLIRVRFDETQANSEYVSGYLNSEYGKKYLLEKAKPSINMSNFSASEFLKIPIPLPTIELQTKFKIIKESIQQKNNNLEIFAYESENLFNSLLQKAFKGEL